MQPSSRGGRAAAPAERVGTIAAMVLLAALLSIEIGAPWIYIHDDNGAWTQTVASAHLKAGLTRTRGQVFYMRRADDGLEPVLHHPPLYPLVMAAAYRITGRSDSFLTRLVPALFHLLGLLGFAILARRLHPSSPALRLIALFIYALVPMSSFFCKMPFNEPLGLCATIWALVWTSRYRARPSSGSLAGALILWTLALATSWPPAAVMLAMFGLFAFEWVGSRGARDEASSRASSSGAAALAFACTALVVLALVVGQMFWAGRGETPGLFAAGSHWSATSLGPIPMLEEIGVAIDFHRRYFANVPFVMFVAWLVMALVRRRPLAEPDRMILAGATGAGLWALVFVRQVALHAYGQFWFLPFESLAAADLAVECWDRLSRRPRLRLALAAIAVVGAMASTAVTLQYRYSHPHGYARRTAREFEERYYTHP